MAELRRQTNDVMEEFQVQAMLDDEQPRRPAKPTPPPVPPTPAKPESGDA
jgi:hypothetical protein